MFDFPPEKPKASVYSTDSYGFADQAWPRFDFGQYSAPSSGIQTQQSHDRRQLFGDVGGMDWAPAPSDMPTDYHYGHQQQDNQGHTAMELEAPSTPQNGRGGGGGGGGGGGVGRLVAHFENKGFNPFEQKSSAPPLPPRPVSTAVSNSNHSSSQNHQHTLQSSSVSMNSFQASLSFDPLSYCGSGVGGRGGNTSFDSNKIASPVTTPGESWGSFHSMQRVTSPISTSPPPLSYGSFQENTAASPVATSSSGQFGSLDDFMSSNRMQSSVAHSPMPNTHMASSPMMASPVTPSSADRIAPTVGGTPGFEIWRPPGSTTVKMNPSPPNSFNTISTSAMATFNSSSHRNVNNNSSSSSNSISDTYFNVRKNNQNAPTNSAGFFKPPVPKTPKPNISAGNQFILELNPSAKAKGKAPAKPPRSKVPPPIPMLLMPEVKQEPATPEPLNVPLASPTPGSAFSMPDQKPELISLRSQVGTRPSREQVPAEAWEQFKPTIRTLYLEERKPLKEVMSIMVDKYSFQATPKMYKTRFSQWGFVKNNTEDEVKRLLSMKFQRDAEGKVSEFVRNGRVVNLGTYLKRKGVTEYDLVDFELPADLPAHIRCRTPTPPPTPGYLQSPDLIRAQELVVGNMRKAFLHCRQFEVETDARIGWPVTMVWGAGSSDLLLEANFYFEARDADQGGDFLMKAFKQVELDLKKLSPLGIIELLLGMVHRDPGMMTALCKYLAAYSTTNFERSHPLRQIFICLYEVQQKHGSMTVSELLWGGIPTIAKELEAIYSSRHPYVARTWIDLALFYNYVNNERFEKLASDLRLQQRQIEQRFGTNSPEALSLRYALTQSLYVASPQSEATRNAAHEMWNHLKNMGVVFGIRDAKPNVYCYHSPVKVDPWTKRCRRRYDSGVAIFEELVGVRIQPYFEEDFHHCVHVPDAAEAWSSALDHMGSGKFAFI